MSVGGKPAETCNKASADLSGRFWSGLYNFMRGTFGLHICRSEKEEPNSISKNTYLLINFTVLVEGFLCANPLHQTKPVLLLCWDILRKVRH